MANQDKDANTANSEALDFPPELKARAHEFFAKGSEVAYTLNYDYAIELYLDGLSYWPDSLEEGHKPLREIALRRHATGKKKSGFGDSSKYKKSSAKNPKDAMLKAEYLLSKDPTNTGHMSEMAKAAADADCHQTARWMADILFDLNLHKEKPSLQSYVFLRDVYTKAHAYQRALQACQLALQLKPQDAALEDSHRDLSAQAAMQHGKYDTAEDFRDSIKDRQEQQKLHVQTQVVQSQAHHDDTIAQARQAYQEDPNVPGKINKLVAALIAAEDAEQENEAISILENAYTQSGRFQYKQRSGEITIKQLNRKSRNLQQKLKDEPHNNQLKADITEMGQQVLTIELEHYKLCVENYPTDMGFKFEYGRRLMLAKHYDDAIPMFQEARTEPRHRIVATNYIGQCFFYKQWYADAVETFQQALEAVENPESAVAKELRYNLGRAHQADGHSEQALSCFRKVAQIDFNYRDVKDRIEALRQKPREP